MKFEFDKCYTADELLDIFELPLCVRRGGWTPDFCFKILSVNDRYLYGDTYKQGKVYASNKTYKRDDVYYVCKEFEPTFKVVDNGFVDGLIPYKTKVKLLKNGVWCEALFVKFESKPAGKVVWVKYEGRESFYAYPSKHVAFDRQEEIDKTPKVRRFVVKGEFKEIDLSVARKYPIAIPATDSSDTEIQVERQYHEGVDGYLLEKVELAREDLREVSELRILASQEEREGNREARAIGAHMYNSHYAAADRHRARADGLEDKTFTTINNLQRVRRTPYFARMDFGPAKTDIHTVYIGEESIDGNRVVDWRNSTIGKLFYFSDEIRSSRELFIPLKRHITISDCVFRGYLDEVNEYLDGFVSQIGTQELNNNTDELFNLLLTESRNEQEVHDIIKTIRSNQYNILSSDFNRNILVNGCAGSGKTMILYHRLSYIAYNDPERFDPSRCYVITPTARFASINDKLFEKLKLTDICNCTFDYYLRHLISRFCEENDIFDSSVFTLDAQVNNGIVNAEYYSKAAYNKFLSEIEAIKSDTRDFYLWYTRRINKYLEACGFESVSEIEILLGKDSPLTLHYKKHPKIAEARSDSLFTLTDWDSLVSEAKTRKNDLVTKLKQYEFPLKAILKPYKKDTDKVISTYNGMSNQDWEKFILLQLLDKHISVLRRFYRNPSNDSEIILSICEYALLQMKKRDPLLNEKEFYRFELLYYLRVISSNQHALDPSARNLIFVDEFQNYSPFELDTIADIFDDAVFNFYGDFAQKMVHTGIGIDDLKEKFLPETYEISENYRNAKEITEFINEQLGMEMLPIGLHGTVTFDYLEQCDFSISGRTALLVDGDVEVIYELLRKRKIKVNKTYSTYKIDVDKLNLLTIDDAKGLEFETVYVYAPALDENVSEEDSVILKNKKYVAYTRALSSLIILSKRNSQSGK